MVTARGLGGDGRCRGDLSRGSGGRLGFSLGFGESGCEAEASFGLLLLEFVGAAFETEASVCFRKTSLFLLFALEPLALGFGSDAFALLFSHTHARIFDGCIFIPAFTV